LVKDKSVYIIGGGITGLVLAYELLKKGQFAEIIERSDSVGGLAKTLIWKNKLIDLGPHIYHTPDKDVQDYWESEFVGLFHKRDHWSKNLKDGEYYDYPISKEFINNLPEKTKKQINHDLENQDLKSLSKASNYHDYIRILAGKTLQEMFFIRYPEKLWGISTKELDANWAPKRIQIREKNTPFYWGQWSAVGNNGSGSIINSLRDKIIQLGGKITLSDKIDNVITKDYKISAIETANRIINVRNRDIVINTTSYTQISKLLGYKTSLKYRGVILVFLEVNTVNVFPNGVDFIYIDDPSIYFNRISDQNSFIKDKFIDSTIICCEITYSKKDHYDYMREDQLVSDVKDQFVSLGLCNAAEILDYKVVKLPEVYPMFFIGYQGALAQTKEKIDRIGNMYTVGSLAEFAYNDMQILFSKAIDLAQVITDKTFKINKIDKTINKLIFNKVVNISGVDIGADEKAFIIAEIGLNHNGNLDIAKQLIDEAIDAGADAVKLQSYKSEIRVAKNGKTSRYVEKVLSIEETDYEMFLKNELSYEQTKELFNYAKNRAIIFSAPFDIESADELEQLCVDCYKISSFDLVNLPLIRKVALTGKPIIISTGMSYLSEVEEALSEVANCGNKNVILLQCTSSYPCSSEGMNIKAIDTMKYAFNDLPVGLSDHIIGDTVSLAAVARGADVIEKHFTLDKSLEGPDHILSLEPHELKDMVGRIRLIESAMGDGIKQPSLDEVSTMVRFRKTMYSKKEISKGTIISREHITYKGPAYGIYAKFEGIVLGQKFLVDIAEDVPITWDMLGGTPSINK
jgi:sialic acid synthase SpsE/protoporphyrinogen oxidase